MTEKYGARQLARAHSTVDFGAITVSAAGVASGHGQATPLVQVPPPETQLACDVAMSIADP